MLCEIVRREGNLIRRRPLVRISEKEEKEAKIKFKSMQQREVVLSNYDEPVWVLHTQDRGNTKVNFQYKKEKVKEILSLKSIEYDTYISHLKVITVLRLGTCSQPILREMVRYNLEQLIKSNGFTEPEYLTLKDNSSSLKYLVEFLNLINMGTEEYLKACNQTLGGIRTLNKERRGETDNRVVLNEFKSYFIFDDILRREWQRFSEKQKEFYFPFYLFWVVTTILPLRVTEFCVTPLNCIREDIGRFFLTVRRSVLKGNASYDTKIQYYTLEDDYFPKEYEIPAWLYQIIDQWRITTKDYIHPYDILFSFDFTLSTEMATFHRKNKEKTFGSDELNVILKKFYSEIIIEKYGFTIVKEEELCKRYFLDDGEYEMYPNEIMMLQSRHTRHLAMINLILRGCNPMIIKDFAGHESMNLDEHYYENTVKLVRCATKIMFERMKNDTGEGNEWLDIQDQSNLRPLINPKGEYILVDRGKCYSPKKINGDDDDCLKCNGQCEYCRWLIPDRKTKITKKEEAKINEQMRHVLKLLKSPDIEAKIEEYQEITQLLCSNITKYAEKYFKELEDVNREKTKSTIIVEGREL